ncbi:molybdenum cofactor biosynthesis protein MoaD [Helicobacter pullorum]|uniref:Molybdenum cofactor biosynthesis protein MoaD n=1 Tax=Helicobacter pullorum TaxID=35818 RepID=A0AAW3J986_9HELI|nr:MoaD/ThiS family protein [Helicobacter pullorum]KPH51173.1 molybdenum cofactor biosynthesis protein MoaD [Helicobacter pullorum]
MVTIELLGPLGNKSLTSKAKNFYELKQELQKDTEIQKWLQHCAVALNGEIISSLDISFKDGDKIALLPPVCGG